MSKQQDKPIEIEDQIIEGAIDYIKKELHHTLDKKTIKNIRSSLKDALTKFDKNFLTSHKDRIQQHSGIALRDSRSIFSDFFSLPQVELSKAATDKAAQSIVKMYKEIDIDENEQEVRKHSIKNQASLKTALKSYLDTYQDSGLIKYRDVPNHEIITYRDLAQIRTKNPTAFDDAVLKKLDKKSAEKDGIDVLEDVFKKLAHSHGKGYYFPPEVKDKITKELGPLLLKLDDETLKNEELVNYLSVHLIHGKSTFLPRYDITPQRLETIKNALEKTYPPKKQEPVKTEAITTELIQEVKGLKEEIKKLKEMQTKSLLPTPELPPPTIDLPPPVNMMPQAQQSKKKSGSIGKVESRRK
jgi:hypothetical protein